MRRITPPGATFDRILMVLIAACLLWAGVALFRTKPPTTQPCAGVTLVVNDSTQAQCAKLKASQVELHALKNAAKAMNGVLVAGTKIVVKSDTITKPDTVVETVYLSDGTRTATLTDTTDDYRVTVNAVAPPTGDLRLGYTVVSPERSIEVGFVKRSDGYYAVASGRGVRTTESFFQPEKERALSLVVGGAVKGGPAANITGARLNYDAYGAVQYRKDGLDYQLRGGHDGAPYVGLAVQKKVW